MAHWTTQVLAGNRRESSRGIFLSSDGSQDSQAGQERAKYGLFYVGLLSVMKLDSVLLRLDALTPVARVQPLDLGLVMSTPKKNYSDLRKFPNMRKAWDNSWLWMLD